MVGALDSEFSEQAVNALLGKITWPDGRVMGLFESNITVGIGSMIDAILYAGAEGAKELASILVDILDARYSSCGN